jgi:hypothetical protein
MVAIQNFGMLWERNKVDWGRPKVKGRLLGIRAAKRRGARVDFRYQTGIYVLYDEQRIPIWIGQAKVLFDRLRDHKRDHLWNRWTYFTWFGSRRVNNNGNLGLSDKLDWTVNGKASVARDEIEAILIQVLEPRLNRRGSNWRDTEEYLQYVEGEELDEEDEAG